MKIEKVSGSVLRKAGRASLAWMFIHASSRVFSEPSRQAGTAGPFLGKLRAALPVPIPDHRVIVRFNAPVQVVTAVMIAANVAPRLAAAGLAGSMVPTTLAGHAYWKFDEPKERWSHQVQFNKNPAMIGGLLLLVADSGQ